MACFNFTDADKKRIKKAYKSLQEDISIVEKIEIIDELNYEISGDGLFNEARKNYVLSLQTNPESKKIQITEAEKIYAIKRARTNGYTGKESNIKPVLSPLVLDGQQYMIIHGEKRMRVVRRKDGATINIYNTSEPDIEARKKDAVKLVNDSLQERFDDEDKFQTENRTLGGRVINMLTYKHPIKEDGSIPIERKLFKAKESPGMFAEVDKPISSLVGLKLDNEEDNKKYSEGINRIINYIPKSIRDIILSDEDVAQKQEFFTKMGHFLRVFGDLKVPTEEVWNKNWELNENAELVQVKNSLYQAPNYLELLGQYVQAKNENSTDKRTDSSQQLKLDPAIDEITKFYSIKAMADMHKMITDMKNMEYEEIAKVLNVDGDTAVKMKNDFIDHGYVPASSFIADAAKDAYNQLGIATDANINMNIKEGILASMNALIRATMVSSGYVTYNTIESEQTAYSDKMRADYANKSPEEISEIEEDIKNQLQAISYKYDFGGKHLAMFGFTEGKFNKTDKIQNDVFGAINKLKYLNSNEDRRVPSLEPIVEDQRTIKNKTYNVNPDMNTFRTKQNKVKWKYKSDFENVYNQYLETIVNPEDDEDTKQTKALLKKNLLLSLGYEEVNMKKHHISEVSTINSNNDKLERELDVLMGSFLGLKDKHFYIPWAEVASGRMMIQSDMNPQESKLIRSFIEMDSETGSNYSGHGYEMSKSDFGTGSKPKMEMLELAIAQAFDMDPDKNSKASTLKAVREIVDIRRNDIKINEDTTFGRALALILDLEGKDQLDMGQRKKLSAAYNYIFTEGEGHHGLQAARMLVRMNKWKNELKKNKDAVFYNDLTIETDAITSGMMLTLMQIVDESSIDMLAKGGIFTDYTQEKWSKYTKKWLGKKYKAEGIKISAKNIVFGPASLIEAGNYHQKLIENGEAPESHEPGGEEVYQDLYKTIGLEMKGTVDATKLSIDQELSSLYGTSIKLKGILIDGGELSPADDHTLKATDRAIERLEVQKNLLSVIGEINPKVLRKIAKDPVMVFIYGSTINSIRKKLGMSVGQDKFIDSIKTTKKLMNKKQRGETLEENEETDLENAENFVQSVINAYVTKVGYSETFNPKKHMKYEKEVDGQMVEETWEGADDIPDYEKLMYLKISDDMQSVLQDAVNDTFGDAIEEAFDRRTGSVEKYRNMMKSTELVSFELFRAKTETYKRKIAETGKPMSKADFDRMLKELEESGFGHDVPTGDAKTTNRRLPLIKMENTGSNGSASVTLQFNKEDLIDPETGELSDKKMNTQSRLYAYLMSKEFVSNTGAAPTTSIHQMDSRGITVTIDGNAWLSIYDAVVQASDPKNVEYSNDTYNSKIFEQNSDRDILGDNIRKVEMMLSDLNQRVKNGDSDAKIELNEIKSRLSTVEEVKIDLNTHTYDNNGKKAMTVVSPMLVVDKINHTGKMVLGKTNKEYDATSVDVLTKTFKDDTKIIKEVYWKRIKGKNGKPEKSINKTIVKTIKNDKMDVVVVSTQALYGGEKQGIKVEYTIHGENQIKAHNVLTPLKKYVYDSNSFTIEDLNTEYVSLAKNDGKLLNIIELEIGETIFDPSVNIFALKGFENQKGYEPSPLGSDFKKESARLFLPVEAISSNISAIKQAQKVRHENLSKMKWHMAHAAISDTTPISVGSYKGSAGSVNTKEITKLLDSVNKQNKENNIKYLENQQFTFFENPELESDEKAYKRIVYQAIEETKGTKSEPFIIGGERDSFIPNLYKKVNLHNAGYYNVDSIATILPMLDEYAMKANGKLSSNYKDIDKALKVNATFITAPSKKISEQMSDAVNAYELTNKDNIVRVLKIMNPRFKMTDAIKSQISAYQIENYLKINGYEISENKNGLNVWKPIDLGYNDNVKSNAEALALVEKIMNCE